MTSDFTSVASVVALLLKFFAAGLGVAFGMSLLTLVKQGSIKFVEYLGSPVNGKLSLNWSVRQFLLLFNKQMSERWYESRSFLRQSVFISLCCAFGLVQAVRFEYEMNDDDGCIAFRNRLYWFKSDKALFNNKKQFLLSEMNDIRKDIVDAVCCYQIFVCGHNIVWDYMNGDFDD